jgi:ceramide glucosyltransferase
VTALSIIGWTCTALAAVGSLYTVVAAISVRRFFTLRTGPSSSDAAVTILKPLHGAEPRLFENLSSFLTLDHHGPVQMVCGVQRGDDPAIDAVNALRAAFPDARIDLVVDGTPHGANGKIANLINMSASIAHSLVVLSDSDIAVAPNYLSQLITALESPDAGVATCLYRGRGDAGFWSRLGAAGLSYQFLPNAVFATVTGQVGDACMGSTIALRRETLEAIGGFARFADILADDHAIGAAVRAIGLTVKIPPMLVTHGSDDARLSALWQHELRWAATVRGVAGGAAYAGSLITLPFPLALIAAILHPAAGLVMLAIALLSRWFVLRAVDRVAGHPTASFALLPVRDVMSFAIFVASFCVRSVDWRGHRLRMRDHGRIAVNTELY